ncbi:MAG: DNA-binding protein, partial [Planctomycetes bacterium]|nr:DNA-binding protein [Planctomycetota bacterium]
MAFLSLEDAAASLGLSTDVLKDLARKKIIRSLSDGGKMMFKSEEVEAYREANAPDAGESLMLDEPMNFELPPPENTVAQTEAEGGSFALMDDGDWDNIKIKTDDPVGATTEML